MKILKRILLLVTVLLVIGGTFIGYRIGSKFYKAYQSEQALTNTILDEPITAADKKAAKSLAEGEIHSEKLIDIATIKPLWDKVSENEALKPEYRHLDDLNFYVISYKSGSELINGILAEPKREGKFPLIIFNRGGNKEVGKVAKAKTLYSLVFAAAKLADEGYVILASTYREADEFGGADLNDVLVLTKTVQTIEKADASRIGMFGWSRGGMMTYLALKESDKIKTAVVGNGPTDLFSLIDERPEMESNVMAELIPDYEKNKEAALKARSVMYWPEALDKNSSLLILAGTQDERVNPKQADKIAAALRKINYDFELKKFDTNHSFTNKQSELNALLIKWFREKL